MLYLRADSPHGGSCAALDSSPFITDIELPSAIERRSRDPHFMVFAVTNGMSLPEVNRRTLSVIGKGLDAFTLCEISPGHSLSDQARKLARRVLAAVVARSVAQDGVRPIVTVSVSTRDRIAVAPQTLLDLDWTDTIHPQQEMPSGASDELLTALRDVREALARSLGLCTVRLTGRMHLSVAAAVGRVFCRPSGFSLEIEQGDSFWATRREVVPAEPVLQACPPEDGDVRSKEIFVGVTATHWDVAPAVRRFVQMRGQEPRRYLWFTPVDRSQFTGVLDDAACREIALQVKLGLAAELRAGHADLVHLFMAVPQALAAMIGHEMNAFPVVQTYEYDNGTYRPSLIIPQELS